MHSLNSLLASEFLISWFPYANLPTTVLWILAIYMITLTRHIIPLNEWGSGILHQISNCFISREEDGYVVAGDVYLPDRPADHIPMKMYISETEEQTKKAVAELREDIQEFEPWIVGLDCEKCPKFRVRAIPCLLQLASLASDEGYAALFRVNKMDALPEDLKKLLEDINIWKVGVGVQNDIEDLQCKYNQAFQARGTLDLRWMARMVGYRQDTLKGLAKEALGAPRNKHKTGQRWDAEELTMDQMQYAAVDAFLGVKLFFNMFNKLINNRTGGKKWEDLLPEERTNELEWLNTELADKFDRHYPPPSTSNFIFTYLNVLNRFFGWNNLSGNTSEQ